MKNLIIVRGGGDLATGTIYKLKKSGFPVLILEVENPSAIRRNVSFCEAVYQGTQTVEDMTCYLAGSLEQACRFLEEGKLTVLVDPQAESISALKPMAVVDAILAKKNLGTHRNMAPITVALGPGFTAGEDVDAVVETKRGHNLGRVLWDGCAAPNTGIPGIIGGYGKERVIHCPAKGILRNVKKITDVVSRGEVIAVVETKRGHNLGRVLWEGCAAPNTGIPGIIGGYGKERVIHCPAKGILRNIKKITDVVSKGEVIAVVESGEGMIPVEATLDGILRGLIRDGYPVTPGFKMADIDPRMDELQNCFTISDKARCIAGGVLEAILQRKGALGL